MSIDVHVLGGGKLPPELAEALTGGHGKRPNFRPATLADIQGLLKGNSQPCFEVGDIVELRDYAKNFFKWPKGGDRCIVTQVLDTPYRAGDTGTGEPAMRKDFALAFVDADDPDRGEIFEYLHDSRHFIKVGSIYDPVKLDNGEELPVTE